MAAKCISRGSASRTSPTHPEIRLAIDHAAIDYDMAHDPAWRSLAVAEDAGKPYSRYFQLPLTSNDLLDRSRLIEAATTLGGTLSGADQGNRHRCVVRAAPGGA